MSLGNFAYRHHQQGGEN